MNQVFYLTQLLHASTHNFFPTKYEKSLGEIFIEIQNHFNPSISLEIGAHYAEFSRSMKNRNPELHVVAYEGSQIVFENANSKFDFLELGIDYRYGVVSNQDGTVKFKQMVDSTTGEIVKTPISSLLDRKDLNSLKKSNYVEKNFEVSSIKGDTCLNAFQTSNACIWIDAEGANKEVLTGLEHFLQTGKISSLLIEVESHEYWENQWLDEDVLNYLTSFNYYPIVQDRQYSQQYNVIYVREDLITGKLIQDIYNNSINIHNSLFAQRCFDFWNSLTLTLGTKFMIGKTFYSLYAANNYRVRDLLCESLPKSCRYSIVFTGVDMLELRITSLSGMSFDNSPLSIFTDSILHNIRNAISSLISYDLFTLKVRRHKKHGNIALQIAYSPMHFSTYIDLIKVFVSTTYPYIKRD